MISIRLRTLAAAGSEPLTVLACPVIASAPSEAEAAARPMAPLSDDLAAEAQAYLAETKHSGKAGLIEKLPRPTRTPGKVYFAGVGTGDEAGWRAAGAALSRAAARDAELTVLVPHDLGTAALSGLAEGLWLGEYSYRLREPKASEIRALATVTVLIESSPELARALDTTRVIAREVIFARDLTNTPALTKTPEWFVAQVRERAPGGLTLTVWEPDQLAAEGFGGILAVGGGSARGPRLLQAAWQPAGAIEHVVLVGKGITYDTGGIDIKPPEAMLLMRKDMGGAATVIATVLAAAQLNLPVRITALAPLAENLVSGSAWRSGDVVRHYGGLTSEVHSTDAEGRVVLADAMAYAVSRLDPDLLVDLATLTGASRVALGKKTAALFTESDELATQLSQAAADSGEKVWRMPLAEEYAKDVVAEIADLNNAAGSPGAITAALYLREFAGDRRDRWVHVDMSAPSWSGEEDGELRKGATGWGVRTLVRWLGARSA